MLNRGASGSIGIFIAISLERTMATSVPTDPPVSGAQSMDLASWAKLALFLRKLIEINLQSSGGITE